MLMLTLSGSLTAPDVNAVSNSARNGSTGPATSTATGDCRPATASRATATTAVRNARRFSGRTSASMVPGWCLVR